MRYSKPPLIVRIHFLCAGLAIFWFISDLLLGYFYWHTAIGVLHQALDWNMLATLQNGIADYVALFGAAGFITGLIAGWFGRNCSERIVEWIWISWALGVLCVFLQPSYGVA